MSIVLVSYATPNFLSSQRRLEHSARSNGIQRCLSFNPLWLRLYRPDFWRQRRTLLRASRGGGYWVWKPFLVLQMLERLQPHETLVYLDAGIEILRPLQPLVECCRESGGVLTFHSGGHCSRWTKRDAFVLLGCDHEPAWSARMVAGGMLVLQKTARALTLMRNWSRLCGDPRLVSDLPNQCGLANLADFQDHRHDQSLLSLLVHQHEIVPYRSPCQFADYLKMPEFRGAQDWLGSRSHAEDHQIFWNSPYATLLNVHRTRNSTRIWQRPRLFLEQLWRALRLGRLAVR